MVGSVATCRRTAEESHMKLRSGRITLASASGGSDAASDSDRASISQRPKNTQNRYGAPQGHRVPSRLTLGTWNVRSLSRLKPGRVELLCSELNRLSVDIVAITEARLCGNGDRQTCEATGKHAFHLFYSGQQNSAFNGVGLS